MSGEVFSSLLFLLPWRERLEERKIIVVLTESLTLNRSESRRDCSGFSTADVKLFSNSPFALCYLQLDLFLLGFFEEWLYLLARQL